MMSSPFGPSFLATSSKFAPSPLSSSRMMLSGFWMLCFGF